MNNQWAWLRLRLPNESSSTNHGCYLFHWAWVYQFFNGCLNCALESVASTFPFGRHLFESVARSVLQQVEHFQDPSMTVADAFKSCTRFWDRITHPAQLMVSLPQAVATMMDPATSGPAFMALPQDIQAVAYDYPEVFFEEKIHRSPRPRPDRDSIAEAVEILKSAEKANDRSRWRSILLRRSCHPYWLCRKTWHPGN